ncbi:uncharacterized protein BKCO1_1000643 [Diplodia corticola]|uniref:RNase H type-1 domain-containing protein n=1 Tax=Diplodia corticola TaxID=236234 RepID=A0A1J9RJE3_9PEZI|nr:uncharacterized protein BKCO1_1000643 [Diplodia corticola]OJD40585.1 hypothetical protein BKCO1_1000643 [Diplodia corticola]
MSAPASESALTAAAASTKPARAGVPLIPHNNKMFHGKCWTTAEQPDTPENLEHVLFWAKEEYTRDDSGYRLTLWTDAGIHQTNEASEQEGGGPEGTNCASAVVYRRQLTDEDWEWAEDTLCHEGTVTIRFGELSAVLLALRKALQIVSFPAGAHITHVAIYSDNLRVVQWIRDYRKGARHYKRWPGYFRAEVAEVVNLTNSMRRIGVQVELAWIPGHANIEGNVLADHVARRAAGTLPTWPRTPAGWDRLFENGLEEFGRRWKDIKERRWAKRALAGRRCGNFTAVDTAEMLR